MVKPSVRSHTCMGVAQAPAQLSTPSLCDPPGRQTTLNLPRECAHLFGTAFPLCSPLELCFRCLKKFGEEAEGLRRGGGAGTEGPEQLLDSPTGG